MNLTISYIAASKFARIRATISKLTVPVALVPSDTVALDMRDWADASRVAPESLSMCEADVSRRYSCLLLDSQVRFCAKGDTWKEAIEW